jgi:hypothetical protein
MNKYIVTTDAYNEEIEVVYAERFYINPAGALLLYTGGDEFDFGDLHSAYNPKAWDKVELAVEDETNPE